jgi:hypothetical protein
MGTIEQLLGGRTQMDAVANKLLMKNQNDHFDVSKFTDELKNAHVTVNSTISNSNRQWNVKNGKTGTYKNKTVLK